MPMEARQCNLQVNLSLLPKVRISRASRRHELSERLVSNRINREELHKSKNKTQKDLLFDSSDAVAQFASDG